MNELSNKTLAEIVSKHNATADVFTSYNIDFCSDADMTLGEICTKKFLQESRLQEALNKVIENESHENVDYTELTLSDISATIRNGFHEDLKNKISELTNLSRRIHQDYNDRKLNQVHDQLLAIFNHLAPHMLKEEKVLFPYLEYMEHMVSQGKVPKIASFGKVKKNVSTMLDEHRDSTDMLNKLKVLADGYKCPNGADEALVQYYDELKEMDNNLRMHIHVENNVLFKKARIMEEAAFS